MDPNLLTALGLLLLAFVLLAKEFHFSKRFYKREDTRRVRSYFSRKMRLQDLSNEIKDRDRKHKEEIAKKKKKKN